MFAFIKGELISMTEEGIVLENNGLGYEISVPMSVMNQLPSTGKEIKIFTYLYVREDALKLYGFLTKDDLNVFKLLITVNGIGPKGALGILSSITPDDLRFAVLANDINTIKKAPGIGAKTAGKLILELKDKLKLEDAFEQRFENKQEDVGSALERTNLNEAVQALTALGYSAADAWKAVRKIPFTEYMSVEELLKQSLKYISL